MVGDERRAVLGTAVGYGREQIRVFVDSLRSVGYTGDIVLLIGPFQFGFRAYLRGRGIKPVTAFCIRRFHGPIFTYRFELLARYLRRHGNRYSQVLVSDVRDVVFQRHPFEGITNACHFFLESARSKISTEPTNMRWMQTFLEPDDVEKISKCHISCCGVSLGGIHSMTIYLNRMASHLRSVPLRVKRRHGADTAFHNLIVHFSDEVDRVVVENNQHVATIGIEPPSTYSIDGDGRVRTADGVPAILHQYDRVSHLRDAIAASYGKADAA
jgi:hypothetical protein